MKRDFIVCNVPLEQVEKLADIIGYSSAAAGCLRWAAQHGGKENCGYFRTASGMLVAYELNPRAQQEPANSR